MTPCLGLGQHLGDLDEPGAFEAASRGVSRSSMRVRIDGSAPATSRIRTAAMFRSATAMCSAVQSFKPR